MLNNASDAENKIEEVGVYPEQLLRRRRVRANPFGPIGSYPVPNLRPGSWGTGYAPPPRVLGSEGEDWIAINQEDAEELAVSPGEGHWLSRIEPDLLFQRGEQYRARNSSSRTSTDFVLNNWFN